MKFSSAYSARTPVLLDCSVEPSMTKQSFAAECDINTIMARYEHTGVLDFVNENEARYGEFSAVDYQEAQNIVASANSMFAAMPAALRSRFDNEPAKFLDFVNDERNYLEALDLGLVNARPEPTPQTTPVVAPSVPSEPPKV